MRGILAQYDLGGAVSFEPLSAGTVNTNVRVLTERGAPVFLRINEAKQPADVAFEAGVVEYVAARGVPTPAPYRTRAGLPYAEFKGQPVTLFPWISGRHLGAREVRRRHVEGVGAALARLHLAGADFTERREGIYTLDHIARRLKTFARSGDPKLAQAVPLLSEEVARLPHERAPGLPEGIIHQDLFRDNVLFGGDDGITALIDFEQAVWGRFAYDLAVCLLAWCFQDDSFEHALVQAMVASYERVRPLRTEERAGLLAEARVVAVRFTVTRVTDVYLRSTAAPAGKDFRSYLARVRVLRERGLPL
ncbi:MAG TPA: homoserine kinase [Polyangia bacterium]|nr:homoserine kinase [Polyangia bacterium]